MNPTVVDEHHAIEDAASIAELTPWDGTRGHHRRDREVPLCEQAGQMSDLERSMGAAPPSLPFLTTAGGAAQPSHGLPRRPASATTSLQWGGASRSLWCRRHARHSRHFPNKRSRRSRGEHTRGSRRHSVPQRH